MKESEILEAIAHQKEIILKNKSDLRESDYMALKHADGVMTDEEYASVNERRQNYRDAINAAEEEIGRLNHIIPEEDPRVMGRDLVD